MSKTLFQKALPHIIAIIIFLVIAVIYCKPALDGQVLQQSDITGWKGAIQQSVKYGETHGHYPLWTNSLFGGMPAFQIGYSANNFVPGIVHTIMTLGLPAPIQYFFLACICFYILSIVLKVNPYVGIMGALGFAYATYNPIIIGVGHLTKMLTMAYMPALLGSLLLIYERKYWLGAALTALFTSTMIAQNHPQIAYYFFITVAIMTIFYVINWIKAKDWKHLAKAIAFTGIAALAGLLTNAVSVMSTYEYQKETIRGGHSSLTDTTAKNDSPKNGLDKTYAFEYSFGITEPLVMMIPRMYGGSSDSKDLDQEKSKAIESMQQLGQQTIQQIAQQTGLNMQQMVSTYWGGIEGGGGTSGPPYVGAIICFLAILSFFVLDGKHKWWALTAILLTIMMSWGSYFKELNNFIFDHFPLYNKFRAPSMILVIPQLLLPMLAALGVNAYINTADKKSLWPKFKKGLIATGILFVIIFLIYFSADFMRSGDKDLLKQIRNSGSTQLADIFKSFYDGLAADRKALFLSDIWRSLGFILLAAATLFLLIRKTIKPLLATILLASFVFIDLILVDKVYLNKEHYEDKADNEANFAKTSFDDAILADTSFYRVFNISGGAYQENMTSYYFNSLGGYHPAKLSLYNDIIQRRLSVEQNAIIQRLQTRQDSLADVNTPTLNMLNAKYFIYKEGATTKAEWQNINALGNCWFINSIRFVKDADAEMAALDTLNPKTTAVVQESFRSSIPFQPQPDSTATIRLVKNDNDIITYTSNSATNQFAVFSEVYYKAGWKAWIDGKESPIIKTNYVLRGLAVPAGKHSIEFKFEPQGYYTGKKLTSFASIALIVLLALAIFMEWRNRNKPVATV